MSNSSTCYTDKSEKEKQEKIKLVASDPQTESDSLSQAYAFKTGQMHEVRRAYRKIKRLHPAADHVVAAYIIRSHKGYQDDREYGAAHRLLKKVEGENTNNVAVYVVRYFSGLHLGPRRFEIINECGIQAVRRLTSPMGVH